MINQRMNWPSIPSPTSFTMPPTSITVHDAITGKPITMTVPAHEVPLRKHPPVNGTRSDIFDQPWRLFDRP